MSQHLLQTGGLELERMADTPEQAWMAGHAADLAGRATSTNPYLADSELGQDWASGWREGRHVRNFRKPDASHPSR
jgi:ribosome modulation factor